MLLMNLAEIDNRTHLGPVQNLARDTREWVHFCRLHYQKHELSVSFVCFGDTKNITELEKVQKRTTKATNRLQQPLYNERKERGPVSFRNNLGKSQKGDICACFSHRQSLPLPPFLPYLRPNE